MGISVDGIVSGIDTTAIIDKLVEAASVPKTVMEEHLGEYEDKKEAFSGLSSRLDDLLTALENMDELSEIAATTGTSSDDTIVGVTVDGDAVKGKYSVEVTQLAAATTDVSNAFADKDTEGTIATGTLSITVGSTTTSVTIDSTNSNLSDLADSINDQVDGVVAYVMDTGDATTPYRLVIVGEDTGTANAVSVDTSGMDPATGTVPTFTESTAAADATLTVNGVSVTSSDNEVEDVVQGVTFNIEDVTTTPVTISVSADTDTMVTTIQAFVDAYNEVRSYIRSNKAFDSDADIKGPFVGEGLVSTVMQKLQTALSDEYATGTNLHALSNMGFETTQDGDIELDTDALKTALADDPDDVFDIFTHESDGFGAALKDVLDQLNDEDEGFIANRNDALDDAIENLEEDISDFEDRMAAYEERLRNQFTAMEIALGQLQNAQGQLAALLESSNSSSKSK